MAHETGKPIIDQLKLCYIADSEILNDLKSIDLCRFKDFGDFVFVRTNCHHFQYAYYVYTDKFGARKHIASARFGRYGDDGTSNYFFYRIENSVLYDTELLKISLSIPESLNMVFHNFTALDIAVDVQTDVARMMKRLWSRKDITTIINGKAVRDRRKIIDNVHIVYSVCLDRVKTMTVCIKQSKAKNNKTKGITVQAYNKSEEIAHSSHKQYISEYYGSPKRLYRLEVHLNNAEIQDYCKKCDMFQSLDMVFDDNLMSDMFYYHLASVIRYTKGRLKLDWKDIIRCNGRL